MDLRSGEPVWRLLNGPPPLYEPLDRDVDCDVAIIGGGITGALIAYELTRIGMHCVLLDKRDVGGGSTSASTALLSYELDTPLFELAGQIGEDDAAACYHACFESIEKLGATVERLGGSRYFASRKSFYLAEEASDVPDLEREAGVRRKHGLRTDFLRAEEIAELFDFARPATLLTHDAAEIDVVQFVSDLLAAGKAMGLEIHARSEVAEFTTGRLRLTHGPSVRARTLVFATGYESEKYLGRKVGTLKSTYAIASQPLAEFPGWHERALIWTSTRPYLYLRTTADGRAVIGGKDIDYQDDKIRDALLPEKTAQLERAFRELFPRIDFQLACAWAGTFGETPDSLACIGQPAEHPGSYFALGYGGNGIAYSMIAAEIIRDGCLGIRNPMARLFRFER